MLADIVIFGFNRPDSLANLLSSLSGCSLADESNVHVFIDGPRNDSDKASIDIIKMSIVKNFFTCFASLNIVYRQKNLGLAKSLRDGIDNLFEKNDRLIVLEDDLILSENFIVYMNQALNFYEGEPSIGSISGFTTSICKPLDYPFDTYFHPRPCSWGWATWKNKWGKCDWNYKPDNFFESLILRKKSSLAGQDVYRMYRNQQLGTINSWAIMWTIHHLRNNLLTVYPYQSMVRNDGFSTLGTHCKGINPFPTNFKSDRNHSFCFNNRLVIERETLKAVNYFHSNFYKLLFRLKLV
ncbi:hypothetical protein [Shewanella chilikensis]|uniref:hypothetical protein n=1 Tax=Shewanella chilikensis TaxID=558541 RepID=UPI003A977ED3